jgi:hypothetical protein
VTQYSYASGKSGPRSYVVIQISPYWGAEDRMLCRVVCALEHNSNFSDFLKPGDATIPLKRNLSPISDEDLAVVLLAQLPGKND